MTSTSEAVARLAMRAVCCAFAIVALSAGHCSSGGDGPAASVPAPSPAPPAPAPVELCWEGIDEIAPDVGCHRIVFDANSSELEVYEALIFPSDQVEFNGFAAAGEPGTPVGTLSLDLDFDDVGEHLVLFRSLDDDMAYADVLADGVFSAAFEPLFGRMARSELFLRLPYGGDANRDTVFVSLAARATLRLRAELMTASLGGSSAYTVSGELTSVDPDTDGRDDGLGAAPTVTPFTADVTIVD